MSKYKLINPGPMILATSTYVKPKLIVVAQCKRMAQDYMHFLQHVVLDTHKDGPLAREYAHDLFRFAGRKAEVLLLHGWERHNHREELMLRVEIGDLKNVTMYYDILVERYLQNN